MSKLSLWKKAQSKNNRILGKTYQQVDMLELNRINGGSDVKPETTPFCIGVIAGLTYSIKKCNK
ncbi:mersacidin family lantibiotic [Staphylococcus equorum]